MPRQAAWGWYFSSWSFFSFSDAFSYGLRANAEHPSQELNRIPSVPTMFDTKTGKEDFGRGNHDDNE
jgi:hypothetical protein